MKTVPLSEARGYVQPEQTQASEEARLYAEIAERLIELVNSTSIARVNKWLCVLAQLQQRDHEAELWFLRFQTGDAAWLTLPYSVIGAQTNRSKQAVEQSLQRALPHIAEVRPELASAIAKYRGIKMDCEVGVEFIDKESFQAKH